MSLTAALLTALLASLEPPSHSARLFPVSFEDPAASAEAFTPPAPQPGWARAGGVLGFGLAAAPLGLTIASVVASYALGLDAQDGLIIAAALSGPLLALVPTFAGRSAQVDDAHARKPRLFRIFGWVLTGMSAVGLVYSTIVGRLLILARLSTGAPSIWGSGFNLIDGAIGSAGLVLLSIAALQSAGAAESSTFSPEPSAASVLRVAPLVAYLPAARGGSLIAGVEATF